MTKAVWVYWKGVGDEGVDGCHQLSRVVTRAEWVWSKGVGENGINGTLSLSRFWADYWKRVLDCNLHGARGRHDVG